MTKSRKTVLFIGSFDTVNKDGGTGGQLFACTTLINSELSQRIDWVLIDSSTKLPIPGIVIRIAKALNRSMKSIYHLLFSRIDVLLVFTAHGLSVLEKGMICILGKFLGKKVIFAPRSGYLLKDLDRPFYRQFIGYLLSRVDIVLCQGSSWQEKLIAAYPDIDKTKYVVRMNWIDDRIYQQPERLIDENLQAIKLSFLGWVEKAKGLEELIYAMHELADKNISLVIAGNGDYFSEAEELVVSLNLHERIKLVGWIDFDAKLSLLANSDIFVFPSHFEGMPNAVLEAMAAGLPIVATEVGGIPDMVSNGQSGILVQPNDQKDLVKALRVLIDDPARRKEMGNNARIQVGRRHNIASAIKDFEHMILD